MWCSILDRSSQGWLNVALCYRSSFLSVLLVFASLSLRSLSSSCSLCPPSLRCVLFCLFMALMLNNLMTAQFYFLPSSGRLLLLAWSSLSLCLHQQLTGSGHLSSYELRQLFLVGLVLWSHREMTCLAPQLSNQTSNPYTSWLNPLLILVSPSGAISVIRSGAPRSNTIHSYHAVDLLDY